MEVALWLFAVQAAIGAFDTLYYHEWKARLPARAPQTSPELQIHAVRDFLYFILFLTLPWLEWHGVWAWILGCIFLAEIALTLTDFVVEMKVRKPIGDVFAGERVTHAIMGIIYGAAVANLFPSLLQWASTSTEFAAARHDAPVALRWLLTASSLGVFASGIRDLYAAFEMPFGAWPWKRERQTS